MKIQAGPVGRLNLKGFEWTEKGLKLNALTLRCSPLVSRWCPIVAPAVEEKPEFDLSGLEVEQEQSQAQNLDSKSLKLKETAAGAHSQNLLPNTGTEKSLLALAGFSILALLGLGWLIKQEKK